MSIFPAKSSGNEECVAISDLMSGLMMVFLSIAIFYLIQINKETTDITNIAEQYDRTRAELYEDLEEEFQNNLEDWGISIDSMTLSVRFHEPDVLFEPGRAELREHFTAILNDFFPRYVEVLTRDRYRNHIKEVRIEGHTSLEWKGLEGLQAYEANMGLSQERTRAVQSYVVRLPGVENLWDSWLREKLTANGLSSSKPVKVGGVVDPKQSRRVEFRVRTDTEEQMEAIFNRIKSD